MDKTKIHMIYGEGKGKTTVAIGQGIRAASQGKSVIIIQFLKQKNMEEFTFVERLEPEVKLFRFQKSEEAFEQLSQECRQDERQNLVNGLNFAKKVLTTESCDVLILDEVLGLVEYDVISAGDLKELLGAASETMEVFLTGNHMVEGLEEVCGDYTEMTTIYR